MSEQSSSTFYASRQPQQYGRYANTPATAAAAATTAATTASTSSASGASAGGPPFKVQSRRGVHLSAYALLFAELIQYAQTRVLSVADLEVRLGELGSEVGRRALELIMLREKMQRREIRVLGALRFVTATAWKHLFGKQADSLERVKDRGNEYIIVENAPLLTRYISVPPDLAAELNCNAFVAGIVSGILVSSGFECTVTAHNVPRQDGVAYPPKTVLVIRFSEGIVARDARLG